MQRMKCSILLPGFEPELLSGGSSTIELREHMLAGASVINL